MSKTNENETLDENPDKALYGAKYLFREATAPEPVEALDKSKGYVKYGAKNLHSQFLYRMYYDSPIHGGIINQKAIFVAGNGVEATGTWEGLNDEIQKNGKSKFTLDELVEMHALDFEVLEGVYILYKKNVTTGQWYADELSGELIRNGEKLNYFFYSDNWKTTSQSLEKTGYRKIPALHKRKPTDNECILYVRTKPKQILIDDKKLSSGVYPIPKYSGAITSILADIEMNWFHYAEVVNGWTSNTILLLKDGVPEPDKQKKILKDIKDQSTDKKKKGGMTVLFSDGDERAAEILTLGGNGNDTKYIITQEHLVKAMMLAHSVQNQSLFGIEVSGRLGNTDAASLTSAFVRFNETYVARRRKRLADAYTHGLTKLNNLPEGGGIEFKEYLPSFERVANEGDEIVSAINLLPVNLQAALLGVLTTNEKRSIAGLPPVEGGDNVQAGEMQFKLTDEETVITMFSGIGSPVNGKQFLKSIEYDHKTTDEDFISAYLKDKFQLDLTDDQTKILQMLEKGETFPAIVSALDKKGTEVAKDMLKLENAGYLEGRESDEGVKVTGDGREAIATAETLSVVYTYELRPDAPPLVEDSKGSRPFCRALIELDRFYTREEIDAISVQVKRDVWSYRGGWLYNVDADQAQPSCRHFWKQNVIIG